jgi:O-antigen/teichoic acid export membrane protein
LFVLLARQMGPQGFGEFMYAFSIGSLAAFAASLGFNQQVMREVAAYPAQAQQIVSITTMAKISLATLVLACLAGLSALFSFNGLLITALAFSAISDTFTEYVFCVTRARGGYAGEAGFMTLASLGHFAFMLLILAYTRDPGLIALAFAASKFTQLLVAWRTFRLALGHIEMRLDIPAQIRHVKDGLPYSADAGLQIFSSQIDTIVIKHTMGAHAAGVYQAGMRLVSGMQNFAVIASNVLLPKLAAQHGDKPNFIKMARKANVLFFALGVALAAVLYIGANLLVQYGYGAEYGDLKSSLYLFAGLIGVRMFAASSGIQLTALGDQKFRTIVNTVGAVALLLTIYFGTAAYGIPGALGALMLCTGGVMLSYTLRVRGILQKEKAQ